MELKNKRVYIAPKTPITMVLKNKIIEDGAIFKGFIDKHKEEDNCIKKEYLSSVIYDYILIFSPNHFESIYTELLFFSSKQKIFHVSLEESKYFYTQEIKIKKNKFYYDPINFELNRKKNVFISKNYVSSNNKYMFLYCIKNNIDCIILTDNKEQIQELKRHRLPVEFLNSKKGHYEIAIAKNLIFDQGTYTYLPRLHKEQVLIQLWHGVGLKKMSKNTNINYDYFVSTSNWTNETNFKNIFCADKFVNLGYPRNDIFFINDITNYNLLFCNKKIFQNIKNNEKKVIIYMPTHKESGFKLAFDLKKMDKFLEKVGAVMILKLHHLVIEYYKKNNIKSNYDNIMLYNAQDDIYPLLKYSDMLITDYSSIAYDYLLLDKPIIFYIHDINEYSQNSPFLFDFYAYTPGVKARNENELIHEITDILNLKDNYKKEREKMLNLFFDYVDGSSSKRIYENIILKELI